MFGLIGLFFHLPDVLCYKIAYFAGRIGLSVFSDIFGNDTGFDQLLNGFNYNNSYLGDMAWFESENKRKTNTLKPESTTSFETGFDLRFLKDRVSLNFTYYNKNTKDQILTSTINGVSGYGEA